MSTQTLRSEFKAYDHIYLNGGSHGSRKWLLAIFCLLVIIVFLPWTQNIRAKGKVTALRQEQRPQQINTIIGGRVEKWYVKEGDIVNQGDTLIQLSEIKESFLDPELINRTAEQIAAKEFSVQYYQGKANLTSDQIVALKSGLIAKRRQLENKLVQSQAMVYSDSMELVAAVNAWKISDLQYVRQKSLYDSGLVSLTQLEQRNQAYQSMIAKKVSAENKFLASKQELNIVNLEFNTLQQEYIEKISKAEGERLASLSDVAAGAGEIAKLKNQFASYTIRNGMYFITAPQNGQIIKASTSGIGEIVKDGQMLIQIVPSEVDFAVELFVRPVDLPLISVGQPVRFLFDGFPAIVFSGWPEASYGTFAGIVSSIENDVSTNGTFRVLVREDGAYRKWPAQLKLGTGANGIALLKDVPIWYELWRNINSFPPDYYTAGKPNDRK
ncbi:MAG: HlyD family efflux transporter periplasmic adaptor subunit [Chitinophagaceae bacterium]|nr:MAG: HlyD family efflux transporter periplasmic adaptor subunit [Chitinophagaceae bacterium]